MKTPKKILSVISVLTFILPVNGNHNQYNQRSNNFLDTNTVKLIDIKDAVDFAMQLTEGNITKAERKFKKEIPLWKIDLITIQNGVIEIEISAVDKSLIRLDADEGPFDYEIDSDKSFISYSAAKKIAEDLSGLKILKWNFFKNKNNWEYNFWLFTKSGKAQVRVNAETGEIITNKKKR